MENDFKELMTPGFVLERYTGKDQFGNNQFDAVNTVTFHAVFNPHTEERGPLGDAAREAVGPEKRDVANLITDTHQIKPRDKITFPTGEVTYVVDAETGYDENGAYYQLVSVREKSQ